VNRAKLQCIRCRTTFETSEPLYRCRECGDLLDVVYDFPHLDVEQVKQTWRQRRASRAPIDVSGVWRYRELIPFYEDESQIVTYPEGNTPLLAAPRCAGYVGLNRVQG